MKDFEMQLSDFHQPQITGDVLLSEVLVTLHIKRGSFFLNPDFGSQLHEIKTTSPQDLALVKQYVERGLQWLITSNKARSITVDVTPSRGSRVNIHITIDGGEYTIPWDVSQGGTPPVDPPVVEPEPELCADCGEPVDDCVCDDVIAPPPETCADCGEIINECVCEYCEDCGKKVNNCECEPLLENEARLKIVEFDNWEIDFNPDNENYNLIHTAYVASGVYPQVPVSGRIVARHPGATVTARWSASYMYGGLTGDVIFDNNGYFSTINAGGNIQGFTSEQSGYRILHITVTAPDGVTQKTYAIQMAVSINITATPPSNYAVIFPLSYGIPRHVNGGVPCKILITQNNVTGVVMIRNADAGENINTTNDRITVTTSDGAYVIGRGGVALNNVPLTQAVSSGDIAALSQNPVNDNWWAPLYNVLDAGNGANCHIRANNAFVIVWQW